MSNPPAFALAFVSDANKFLEEAGRRRAQCMADETLKRNKINQRLRKEANDLIIKLKQTLMDRIVANPDLRFITVCGRNPDLRQTDLGVFVDTSDDGRIKYNISPSWFEPDNFSVLLDQFRVDHHEPWVMEMVNQQPRLWINFGIQS